MADIVAEARAHSFPSHPLPPLPLSLSQRIFLPFDLKEEEKETTGFKLSLKQIVSAKTV